MDRVAAIVSRLELARKVSLNTDEPLQPVHDVCALSAEELLLVYGYAGLRAVSLPTGLFAAKKPIAIRDYVNTIAFDTHTDTLLLVMMAPNVWRWLLVSLRRKASEWLEVQRLDTLIYMNILPPFRCANRVCCL